MRDIIPYNYALVDIIRDNLELDPLAVLHLDNRLYMLPVSLVPCTT